MNEQKYNNLETSIKAIFKSNTEIAKGIQKIVKTALATGTLLLNSNGITEHEKAISYNPTIKQEFKTLGTNTIQNVNDSTDVLITDLKLKENKNYIVSFKNDDIVKIEEK